MRPLALALVLIAAGTGCRSLIVRPYEPMHQKVAKIAWRSIILFPTLGFSEVAVQGEKIAERVELSQAVLDVLYAACRDATPGTDQARRACWDYQRGQEQHAQLLQGVQQWQQQMQATCQAMQQQGNDQIQRGLHPPEPPQPEVVHCTSREVWNGVETTCR